MAKGEAAMRMGKRNQRISGFTVLELMVAVGIAMVVLGIAVPSLLTWLPTLRLSSAARQVATDLQVARMKAISQNRKFRLNFNTTTTYYLESDLNNDGTIASGENDSGPFSLPEGITTTVGTTPEFYPRGTASAAATKTLQNSNSETKSVQVAVVGRVTLN